jgi:FkbM family methyltransferase
MKKRIEAIEHDFAGDLFIDIGGNVGMWSKELYECYDKIFFVEPSELAINKALESIIDSKNKITFYKNIVSSESGLTKSIYSCSDDSGNFSVFGKSLYENTYGIKLTEENIDTITLDDFIDSAEDASKILVKIDTEGSDLDILLGGFDFIKKYSPEIIVEAHFHMYFDQEKFDTIKNFLLDEGYSIKEFRYPDYRSRPDYLFDGVHNGTQMYDLHYQMLITKN